METRKVIEVCHGAIWRMVGRTQKSSRWLSRSMNPTVPDRTSQLASSFAHNHRVAQTIDNVLRSNRRISKKDAIAVVRMLVDF